MADAKAAAEEMLLQERAEAQKKLAKQRQRMKWMTTVTAIVFVVAGIVLWVAIYAWDQKDRAERSQKAEMEAKHTAERAQADALDQRQSALNQRKTADEAKLTAQSLKAAWRGVNMAPEKLDLALLLSAEAFRRGGGQEAKNALLASLLASPHLNSFLRCQSAETTVRSLAFSPDGQTLASADSTGTIILWNLDSGFMVREPIRAHEKYIYSIAFSPDGRYLASASQDKTVKLVDVGWTR